MILLAKIAFDIIYDKHNDNNLFCGRCFGTDLSSWWPSFVILFYILSVVPSLLARRTQNAYTNASYSNDVAIFITMGVVVSAFALPIVLAHSEVVSVQPTLIYPYGWNVCEFLIVFHFLFPFARSQIQYGAAYLTIGGNIVVFATMFSFFLLNDEDSGIYGGGF